MTFTEEKCCAFSTRNGLCERFHSYLTKQCNQREKIACHSLTRMVTCNTPPPTTTTLPPPPLVERPSPMVAKDSDADGVYDHHDEFVTDRKEWKDSDGDGVGDNADPWPYNPNC